jgi:Ca2+-dependent lipid-binding protein
VFAGCVWVVVVVMDGSGVLQAGDLESYVVLECQGQVKRTSVATKSKNPHWDEELAFKSVQIESDLTVTVYGKSSMFRSDLFLGEVVIPLSDLQEGMDSLDNISTYDLSRRTR